MTGAYCLVQGRVWRFYQHNKARLDPLSKLVKLTNNDEAMTVRRKSVCYSLYGAMEICRYNTNPKTNALIDRIYHSQAPCCCSPIPCYTPANAPPPCRCDTFQHLTTHLDAFRQFWHILRYIYFEQDGTDSNICNMNGVKMVTSDLSARINDVLCYVGITRNMNAYIISPDADCRG